MNRFRCASVVIVALTSLFLALISGSSVSQVHEFHNVITNDDNTGRITNCGTYRVSQKSKLLYFSHIFAKY